VSYDLFFRTRSGTLPAERFEAYFRGRPNYTIDARQGFYENSDTGVYFSFEQDDGAESTDDNVDGGPIVATFNMNYFRPSVFALEAQPEVAAFVREFNLTVFDPQDDGMGEGEYDSARFLSGWNAGNAFAYRAFLSDPDYPMPKTLARAAIHRVWTWNSGRSALQARLGDDKFVPAIFFFELSGRIRTYAVWPEGCPLAVPAVDFFYVMRKELAPRRFFWRKEDHALLARKDAQPVFARHKEKRNDALFVLDYLSPPADVREFVTGLPRLKGNLNGVAASEVLDQELVDQGLAAAKKQT
jgi:hypothetical protein